MTLRAAELNSRGHRPLYRTRSLWADAATRGAQTSETIRIGKDHVAGLSVASVEAQAQPTWTESGARLPEPALKAVAILAKRGLD